MNFHSELQNAKRKLDDIERICRAGHFEFLRHKDELHAARDRFFELRIQQIDEQIEELKNLKHHMQDEHKRELGRRYEKNN